MASIVGARKHLGKDHPHFPQADHVVPPHAQPRGTGHDAGGTSGTHLGDTDDDSKEITEDKDGEYKSSDK